MRSMIRLLLVGSMVAGALGASPAGASSKDLCVLDSVGAHFKFKKVASLRKVGSMVALNGLLVFAASPEIARPSLDGIDGGDGEGEGPPAIDSMPVVGTAVTLADGSVKVGVHALGDAQVGGEGGAVASLITDQDFNGAGAIDSDNDGVGDAPYGWTAVDCDEFDAIAGF